MFGFLGRLAARRPWWVIAVWILLAILIPTFSPKLTATTDQADFLPRKYESIKAADLQTKNFPEHTQTGAIIVFDRDDGKPLTDADSTNVQQVIDQLTPKLGPVFDGVAVQPPSDNKLVQLAVVGLKDKETGYDKRAENSLKKLRDDLTSLSTGKNLNHGVTGQVASNYDSNQATKNAEAIIGITTVLLIVVLLSIIFRSVIIALMPILVVGIVSTIATGLIATANKVFDLKIDNSIQVILIVVLFGIGTDYILFFLFRYRERLREGEETRVAVAHALEKAGEAIASAGGAVIVAFMALTLSSLGIFKSIGPALAIAVAVTLLGALTLVPAVSALLGRALFWPSKKWREEPKSARFAAIGASMGRHPARFAIASGAFLIVFAVLAFGFKPTFDLSSSGVPQTSESAVALKNLEKGLPAGATDPSQVYLHSTNGSKLTDEQTSAFATSLRNANGVAAVTPTKASTDGTTELFSMLLKNDPTSDAAISDMKNSIRGAAHSAAPANTQALVGGTTSVFVDFEAAMNRDYSVVFPVAALVILIILALLLRSLVAPLYLIASVGLGFGATLGATVLVFQNIKGDDGLIFLLPIYIYLFVVALGTDYNILMIARLREEARNGKSSREAVAQSVRYAGPTVAAAGLILAGTFASLMLGGNALLVSMGFAISTGIFVAAFVMAMFFTPSLTALIGHAAWWPGHGDEQAKEQVN